MPAEPGVTFGRYRLVEQLGAGGMARVFRSVIDGPKGFAHELCIKRIRPEYSAHAHFVNMLASEARLCGLLRHPGIVQVHEFGEVGGEYYLAMELVDGFDLLAVARALNKAERRVPLPVACFIIHELASALGYAHALVDHDGRSLQVVHRDISPSNIMIGQQGTVKLLDFGIAKAAAHVRDEQTTTGTLKGKIGYMSPEQAEGLPLDGRSDLFALGVVFWELLTQRRLFRADSDLERLRMVREAKVEPPSKLVPGIDPALDALVLRLLARDREQRFQRGEDVAAALLPFGGSGGQLRALLAELTPYFPARSGAVLGPEDARYLPDSLSLHAMGPPTAAGRAARRGGTTWTGAASRGELQSIDSSLLRPSPSWWSLRRWGGPALGAALTLGIVAASGWRRPGSAPTAAPASAGPASAAGTHVGASPASTAGAGVGTSSASAAGAGAGASLAGAAGAHVGGVAEPGGGAAATSGGGVAAGDGVVAPPIMTVRTHVEAPRRAESVHLRIGGASGAEVYVDGRLVGDVPLDVVLPATSGERHVSVRRSGFASWTRTIAGDTSVALTAKLARRAARAVDVPIEGRIYDPFAQ